MKRVKREFKLAGIAKSFTLVGNSTSDEAYISYFEIWAEKFRRGGYKSETMAVAMEDWKETSRSQFSASVSDLLRRAAKITGFDASTPYFWRPKNLHTGFSSKFDRNGIQTSWATCGDDIAIAVGTLGNGMMEFGVDIELNREKLGPAKKEMLEKTEQMVVDLHEFLVMMFDKEGFKVAASADVSESWFHAARARWSDVRMEVLGATIRQLLSDLFDLRKAVRLENVDADKENIAKKVANVGVTIEGAPIHIIVPFITEDGHIHFHSLNGGEEVSNADDIPTDVTWIEKLIAAADMKGSMYRSAHIPRTDETEAWFAAQTKCWNPWHPDIDSRHPVYVFMDALKCVEAIDRGFAIYHEGTTMRIGPSIASIIASRA